MTGPTTAEEIRVALGHNNEAPYGRLRTATAERLAEAATQTGNAPLTILALQELISAYEFGGEADKLLVPFARVLRMWDDNPADFDRWSTHRMHWHFKWVCSGMLAHPNVALSTIHRWLEEMATRYRRLGHGTQAVHAQRHFVAEHIGDTAVAQAAFDAWRAAERDEMSDCHACERKGQGDWYVVGARDRDAIASWEPVLGGELTCEEEPHRTLASSLLPLVRLGELGQARANHLRGYRMVRGKPDLRESVGLHLEFAALTGNEARGLELLDHHQAWLTRAEETAAARLSFLEGAAVLLRRLLLLGHGELVVADTPVAGLLSRVEAEVADLARQFDARNSTSAVSDRSVIRLAQEPLVEALSLGTRLAPRTVQRPVAVAFEAEVDLAALIAIARERSDTDHPHAAAAWERVAAAGGETDPRVALEIAEARAGQAPDADTARPLFLEISQRYRRLPDPARALVSRARATPDRDAEVAELLAEVARRRADGGLGDRDYLRVLLYRARHAHRRWQSPTGQSQVDSSYAAFEATTDELARAATELDQPWFAAWAAALRGIGRHVAGLHELAVEPLTRAVDGFEAAGTPWHAVQPLFILFGHASGAGDHAQAETYAREALRHGAETLTAAASAQLTLQVADAVWHQSGREDEVIDLALVAADRFDRAGAELAGASAIPRVLAGRAFLRSGRPSEAVAILETTVPELERYGDEQDVVQAKEALFRGLTALGEHRDASRVILSAAAIASTWPDQSAHAALAHEAGSSLESADLPDEAAKAYGRARELWLQVGRPGQSVRATRAQAWTRIGRPEPDWPAGLALLEEALAAAAPLAEERAETRHQLAQLLYRWALASPSPAPARRAVAEADLAGAEFAALGDFPRADETVLLAADAEHSLLGLGPAARDRLSALRAAALARGDEATVRRCDHTLRRYAAT